ncbi:MAG: hypothetical protein R3C45_04380 [Phycisphaerales bacterium]
MNPSYYQNNRNAYIDHPEYVWSIYGRGNNDANSPSSGRESRRQFLHDCGPGARDHRLGRARRAIGNIIKTGADPTYYEVTASGARPRRSTAGTTLLSTVWALKAIQAGLNSSTATAGLKTGTITIDNIGDLPPVARGQAPPTPTTSSPSTSTSSTIPTPRSSPASTRTCSRSTSARSVSAVSSTWRSTFSTSSTLGFTADLDLDSILGSGDTGVLGS